jgi:formate--tetrahydrofolate ligase
VNNLQNVYHLPVVVAVNCFPTDTQAEVETIVEACREQNVRAISCTHWAEGGKGAEELAKEVVRLCDAEHEAFTFAYDLEGGLQERIETLVKKIYHGDGVSFTPAALKQLNELTKLGYGNMPICVAKTQYSFSDNPALLGAPKDFTVQVRSLRVSAGAGFVVVLTGDIMTMPGLPKVPAAEKIDVDENGRISGLF